MDQIMTFITNNNLNLDEYKKIQSLIKDKINSIECENLTLQIKNNFLDRLKIFSFNYKDYIFFSSFDLIDVVIEKYKLLIDTFFISKTKYKKFCYMYKGKMLIKFDLFELELVFNGCTDAEHNMKLFYNSKLIGDSSGTDILNIVSVDELYSRIENSINLSFDEFDQFIQMFAYCFSYADIVS